jgi:hypothetical protein
VKVFRKFRGHVGHLQRAAADIVRPLAASPGFGMFARWFKNARAQVPALRLLFSSGSAEVLARLKLENLDAGVLGEEFPQDVIIVESNADHFDLMAPDRVLRHVAELVAAARAVRRRRVSDPGDTDTTGGSAL